MSGGCPLSGECLVSSLEFCACPMSGPESGECLVFVECPVTEQCLVAICCLVSGTGCDLSSICMSSDCPVSGGLSLECLEWTVWKTLAFQSPFGTELACL